ncbi:P-loop containing nucleoside triphosphate hydrolase protein [Exophiala viscosa]|uniref:P-loop containing nucleoside triphosphate hydrolase protein n=1 Tax=Exophiala viscosa TaxID=2486360 RepID=UPI002199152E|nr:P-loop containing nucleoside triphosphate hydrolase protein [Exophiala viscosa]
MSIHYDYDAHLYALTPIEGSHNNELHKPLAATESRAQSLWSHRWNRKAKAPDLLRNRYCLAEKITNGSHKQLSFQVHTAYISYLQLALHDPAKTPSDDNKPVIVKLSKDSCSALEFHEIRTSDYEHLAGERPDEPYNCFHLMLVEYKPDLVSYEGLFIEDSRSYQSVKAALKSTTVCALLIKSRDKSSFEYNTSSLTERFSAEKRTNPLSRWIYTLKRQTLLKDRPPVLFSLPKTSFFHLQDYIGVLGVGTLIVKEIVEKKKTESIVSPVVFLPHHEAGTRKFIALFKVPRRRQEDFSPGEKASASFRPGTIAPSDDDGNDCGSSCVTDESDNEQSPLENGGLGYGGAKRSRLPWDVRILRPIPSSGIGVSTAIVERRRHKDTGRFIDDQLLSVTPLGAEFRTSPAAFRALLESSKTSCRVVPDLRHSIFYYVFPALEVLERRLCSPFGRSLDKALSEALLSNDFESVPKFNIYWSLSNDKYADEQYMDLNESQMGATRLGYEAPAGFVICHGGPGTGKTHFVIQAVKPFLLDADAEHRLLLTSAGNRGVDSMARGLNRLLQELINSWKSSPKRYVIRLHSIKTEMSILLRHAETLREKALDKKQKSSLAAGNDTGKSADGASKGSDWSHPVLAHCQNFAACKFEGVQDERVQDITLSLGEKMLENAGIKTGPLSDAAYLFTSFRGSYARYSRGENVDPEQWDLQIKELMRYTIAHATALCATVAGAADGFVAKSYRDAELLVVDEASKVPEFQWWPLLAFYPNAAGKIMVGDPDQLPPHIETDKDKSVYNPFLPQLRTSLQGRFQAAGFKCAFFTMQYRAVPQIAEIYNTACYASRLRHHDATLLGARPLAMDVQLHNRQRYGMGSSVIFRDVPTAEAQRLDSGSKFCAAYAMVAVSILQDLLVSGFGSSTKPCHIAILTPYKEQQRILQISRTRMAAVYPDAANVTIETVDSVQGLEYDIVIVDPVAVRKPGFLNKNRLNVLFSRARCGLYVVGSADDWASMRSTDSSALKSFCAQLMPYRYRAKRAVSSKFFDSDMLAKDVEDE